MMMPNHTEENRRTTRPRTGTFASRSSALPAAAGTLPTALMAPSMGHSGGGVGAGRNGPGLEDLAVEEWKVVIENEPAKRTGERV